MVKLPTSLSVPDRTGTITGSVTLRGYLKRVSDSAWLNGRTVSFAIDGTGVGSGITGAAGSPGRADLNWVIPSGPALRAISGTFGGSPTYESSADAGVLTCQTWATKMAGFDRTARITQQTELKCRLLTTTNVPLYGKPVDFFVDGSFVITRTTDTQGYAKYPYYTVPNGAGAGTRTILASWQGNGGYLASSKTATLTVQKAIPYIWVMPRTTAPGGIANLYAYFRRLYDYQQQDGKTVAFRVDGTVVQSVVTDAGGVARYAYPTVEAQGVYPLRCEFGGDAWVDTGYGETTLTIR